MFHNRGPTVARPSKATPNTQCQKCLQRGHYTYECKAAAQERPYISRPSRTQQLMNPKLQPELNKVVVPEELLKKKGVADDILKKKEEERRKEREKKRGREYNDLDRAPRTRRRRSLSADSVATISTNASRSRSRSPPRKRSRSRSPRRSRRDDKRGRHDYESERHHHHRSRRSPSTAAQPVVMRDDPVSFPRGRGSSRSVDREGYKADERSRSRSPLPPLAADPMDRLASRKSADRERSLSRRRSRSLSPLGQKMPLDRDDAMPGRGTRERSYSRERSLSRGGRKERHSREGSRDDGKAPPPPPRTEAPRRDGPPRERSMSPFSKRVALTKQMGGR